MTPFLAISQELKKKDFGIALTDIEARTNPVQDINGDYCALVKIHIPILQGLQVESSNLIGEPEHTVGEYKVYLCEGTRKVTLKHPNYVPTIIDFGEKLKGKTTYVLTLELPRSEDNTTLVQILTNVNLCDLKIDDKTYSTTDGRFNIKLSPGEYDYTITTSSKGFKPLAGKVVVTQEDVDNAFKDMPRQNLMTDQKYTLYLSAPKSTEIYIDGNKIKNWNKGQLLTAGRHEVKAKLGDINKTFEVYLDGEDKTLDADLRNTLRVAYPLNASIEISPKSGAMKPSMSKFKTGDKIKISGSYKLKIKKSGYLDREIDIEAIPGNPLQYDGIIVDLDCEADNWYSGINGKTNIKKALKKYTEMAQKGDDYANMALAKHYNQGSLEGILQNMESRQYLDKAAMYGNPEANYIKGVAQEGFNDYLKKAMEAGHREAIIEWAMRMVKDNILPNGSKASNETLKHEVFKTLESVSNHPKAKYLKGIIYAFKLNDPLGIEYFEDLLANPEYKGLGLGLLGDAYYDGVCVPKDKEKGVRYYKETPLEALGPQSRLNMGMHCLIEEQNKIDADKYLYKLNLEGLDSKNVDKATLMRNLGFYFYGTDAAKRDYAKAYYYFDYAYRLGDRSPKTTLVLGDLYREGKGGATRDYDKALSYLNESAENNEPTAYRLMGLIYEAKGNKEKAKACYETGVQLGDLPCISNLGSLYAESKQYEKALKYWKDAASKGHKKSIKQLIKYYEWKKKPKEAKYWKSKL